jgi:predicted enzyme related to lactoylglutathione lyase
MPQRDTAPLGAPCWVDIMTPDADKTRAFYCDLFGWELDDRGPEYGGYANFVKGGVPLAGSMQSPPDGPSSFWTVYLATDDAKQTVETARGKGAAVYLEPQQVLALGTMAMVADPGGAAIGIWQPGEHKGFGLIAEPGAPGWFELQTREYDASVAFYREVFGWDTHVASDEPDFRYTTLGEEDAALAGIMDGTQHLGEAPSAWSVYFSVEDTDATLAKVAQLGGATVVDAVDTPYGRLATATDVTGAVFKLVG